MLLPNIIRRSSALLLRCGNPTYQYKRRYLHHKINAIQFDLPAAITSSTANATGEHYKEMERNIVRRKNVGNISLIQHLHRELESTSEPNRMAELRHQLEIELKKLPNSTHPTVAQYPDDDEPVLIASYGTQRQFNAFKPRQFAELCKQLNILRTEHLGHFTGAKTYYLLNELAELEEALVQFTVRHLKKHNFKLISVPDILPADVIEGCGMRTSGERNQVYKLTQSPSPDGHGEILCLSGTAEMALAGHFAGRTLTAPIKVMSASRCYRAETSGLQEEKGIFRVHNFLKVEMFSVCPPSDSDRTLEEFRDIEVDLFQRLGLHFKVLDMPPGELGASAYRKYDIEAWMPGRKMFGEISSCSNCTDYQAKRLGIKYADEAKNLVTHAHTINGTACAVPRMLIAILETYQNEDGSITLPEALHPFMGGKTKIVRSKQLPELKLIKSIREKL